jgi:hypothetical protein
LDELTELDYEPAAIVTPAKPAAAAAATDAPPPTPPAPRPAPVRRPRVFSDRVPETIDPFAEAFEEEELVLDSFVTLASIFGTRTPRVENGREPGFSRLVQHALEASTAIASEKEESPAAQAGEMAKVDRASTWPTLRLAVVNDAPPLAVTEPRRGVEEAAPRQRHPAATTPPQPHMNGADLEPDLNASQRTVHCSAVDEIGFDPFDAILVIEDEPAGAGPPQPGVRRENYRQLFSRLRQAT